MCSEEGVVSMKGGTQKIFNVEKIITRYPETKTEQNEDKGVEKFYKRDYFLPLYDMLTAISTQNLQNEGIQLEALNGQNLYCRNGV